VALTAPRSVFPRDQVLTAEGTEFTIVALVAFTSMATLAYACRRDWFAPSAFTALVWAAYLILPLTSGRDYPVAPQAVVKIVGLVLCLYFGAFVAEGPVGGRGATRRMATVHVEPFATAVGDRLLLLSGVCTIAASTGVAYLASLSLRSYGLQNSVDGLLTLGPLLSAERYVEGRYYPTIVRVLLVWIYPAALTGGLAFPALKTRAKRGVALGAFIPAVGLSLIAAIRAGTLFTAVCWLTGYAAVQVCAHRGTYRLFRRTFVVRVAIGTAVAVSFALLIQVLRAGYAQSDDLGTTWEHIRPGVAGSVAAFSEWDKVGPAQLSWGFYTFAGLFDMLGLRSREIGIYLTSVTLSGGDTNIYTAFRGLVEDFGYFGAPVALFVFGFISGFAYRMTKEGRSAHCVILAAFYAACIWSPIASFFVYNGLVLAWVVSAAALWWPHAQRNFRLSAPAMPDIWPVVGAPRTTE
jgi:oligosaccharide repeat unit polymerase